MFSKPYVVGSLSLLALIVAAAGIVGWRFAYFVVPFAWTGEPARLAERLRVGPGSRVADIGAGDGALAVEMARLVGDRGEVYATELSVERRRAITRRLAEAEAPRVRVVEAAVDAINLPAGCCDAVYMRTVFHHIDDHAAFARQIWDAVRPGGRVAVMDFSPGALWFHGRDHGVTPAAITVAFERAGFSLGQRVERWGASMFLLLFERRVE